ncbi:MAG: hypothetical protein ACOYKE_02135 [Ferruginibacter sp.]
MKKLLAFIAVVTPFFSFAHPGHGETEGFTITHYIKEPIHVIATITVIAVAVFIVRRFVGKKASATK